MQISEDNMIKMATMPGEALTQEDSSLETSTLMTYSRTLMMISLGISKATLLNISGLTKWHTSQLGEDLISQM